MPSVMKLRYNQKPIYRAKRILDKLGIPEDFPKYDKMLTEIAREIILDRGRGMNYELYDKELDRARVAWNLCVKNYTEQVMSFNSFSCPLCKKMIREKGQIHEHAEWCPFYNFKLDFVLDLID